VGTFLLGSVPFGYLLNRRRLRRDLSLVGPVDLQRILTGRSSRDLPSVTEVAGTVLDVLKVLAAVWLASTLIHSVSPNVRRGEVPAASTVGFMPEQVLLLWESGALWAGLAAAVGHLWPLWLRFRSAHQGQAAVLALVARVEPVGFVVAVASYLVGLLAAPLASNRHRIDANGRQRAAIAISLIAFVAWSWAAWVWDLRAWWGYPAGAETAIWATVLAGAVATFSLSGRRLSPRS
jgi:glycerol-3-phosphate acyltransferase PlsY